MARFTTFTTTTASVAAGGFLDVDIALQGNTLDITRIKVTPSISAGEQIIAFYKATERASTDIIYKSAAWTGTSYSDPVDSGGSEINQNWIFPYYDDAEANTLYMRIYNNHTVAKTYDIEIDYEYLAGDAPGALGAPEGLIAEAIANGLEITSGVIATVNTVGIYSAEFRATYFAAGTQYAPVDMRTAAEGGTWAPDGTTKIQETVTATPNGAQYIWTSAAQGRWYFVWRMRNAAGWSRWTDGNTTPRYVTQHVDTQDASISDSGPPADWEVWIEEGPSPGTIVVHATRPQTNGTNLLWWCIQVKDGSLGAWLALDDNISPAVTLYDGSTVNHTLSADRTTLTHASGGYGSAAIGDLILLDVRGSNFNVNYCQWGTVESISGTSITVKGFWRPQTTSNLRIRIVTPPWAWTGGGYLGDAENHGFWPTGSESGVGPMGAGWLGGDTNTQEFISTPITVDPSVSDPQARVWFENLYCRSDDNKTSAGDAAGQGMFKAPIDMYNFSDRRLWLPIAPVDRWGGLSFETGGGCTVTTKTNLSYNQNQSGIRARFRLYPDSTGVMYMYCMFTDVVLPVGIHADNRLLLGMFLFSNTKHGYYYTAGATLGVRGTDATKVTLEAPYFAYRNNYYSLGGSTSSIKYMPATNLTRPPVSSTVELRAKLQRGTSSPPYIFRQTIVEARVNGWPAGSWTTITLGGGAPEGGHLACDGLELFIGLLGDCRLTDTQATLYQFSMDNGYGEYY